MLTTTEVPLCDHAGGRLYAVVDELTLTYRVVLRRPDDRDRALRHNLASLREARAWAHRHYPPQRR
jgi:hypothetical protein